MKTSRELCARPLPRTITTSKSRRMGQTISAEQAALPFAFAADADAAGGQRSPGAAVPAQRPALTTGLGEREERDQAATVGLVGVPPSPAATTPDSILASPVQLDIADAEGAADEGEGGAGLRTIRMGQLTSLVTIGLCSQGLSRLSPNVGLLYATTTLQL